MRNKDNKGYTLIEVLLTMVILAIIFVPLMNYFITAGKYAAKSREKEAAIVAGQNLMEELKAADDVEVSLSSVMESFPGHNFKEQSADQSMITFTGNLTQNGKKFSAQVQLKRDTSLGDGSYTDYEIEPMDSSRDIYAMEPQLQKEEALLYFMGLNEKYVADYNSGLSEGERPKTAAGKEAISPYIRRKIQLRETREGGYQRVVVEYRYTFTGSVEGIEGDSTYVLTLADQRLTAGKLQNIYLFYQGDANGDTITISMEDQAKHLYLVCQNKSALPVNYQLFAQEPLGGYAKYVHCNVSSNLAGAIPLVQEKLQAARLTKIAVEIYPLGTLDTDKAYVRLTGTKGGDAVAKAKETP